MTTSSIYRPRCCRSSSQETVPHGRTHLVSLPSLRSSCLLFELTSFPRRPLTSIVASVRLRAGSLIVNGATSSLCELKSVPLELLLTLPIHLPTRSKAPAPSSTVSLTSTPNLPSSSRVTSFAPFFPNCKLCCLLVLLSRPSHSVPLRSTLSVALSKYSLLSPKTVLFKLSTLSKNWEPLNDIVSLSHIALFLVHVGADYLLHIQNMLLSSARTWLSCSGVTKSPSSFLTLKTFVLSLSSSTTSHLC